MKIHGKEYTEVKDRIIEFRNLCPDWSIKTNVFRHGEAFEWVVFHAAVISPTGQEFDGWAYEERTSDSKEVNFSSWVENCETSAIGRALANMGLTLGDQRPSAEEMGKVERAQAKILSTPSDKKDLIEASAKKVLSLSKTTGVRPKALAQFVEMAEALKKAVGHDKYLVQALENRKVKAVNDLTIESMQEISEGFKGMLESFKEIMANEDLGDVSQRKAIALESLDKLGLLV